MEYLISECSQVNKEDTEPSVEVIDTGSIVDHMLNSKSSVLNSDETSPNLTTEVKINKIKSSSLLSREKQLHVIEEVPEEFRTSLQPIPEQSNFESFKTLERFSSHKT